MSDVAREERIVALLNQLALEYHKSTDGTGEGEYGCPGLSCPGVQRLAAFARKCVESVDVASLQREEAQAKELLFFRDTDRYMEWCDVRVLERAEAAEAQVESLKQELDLISSGQWSQLSAQVASLHEALRTLPRYVVVSDTPSYYETPEGSWLKVEDVAALLAHPEGTPTK